MPEAPSFLAMRPVFPPPAQAARQAVRLQPVPFARPRPLFMAILAACLAMPASARTEEVSSQVPAAAATAGSSTRSRQAPVGTPLLLAQSSHAHATSLPACFDHASAMH